MPLKELRSIWSKYAEFFSVALLVLISWPFHFPFQADDYPFLNRALDPGVYDFMDYSAQMSRNPLLYLIAQPTFKSGLFNYGFFPMYFFFFLYAWGLVLAIKGILRDCRNLSTNTQILIGALTAVPFLVLNPNQAEVFYFPICMPYSVGAFALGLMVYSRSNLIKVLSMFIAFASLEAFFFPALGLLCLPKVMQISDDKLVLKIEWKNLVRPVTLWLIAVVLTVLNRLILKQIFPSIDYRLNLDPFYILGQFWVITGMMTTSFFYKTNWLATILEIAGIGTILYSLLRRKNISYLTLLILVIGLILCDAHMFLVSYSAMRAHFGAIFVRSLLLALLVGLFFKNETRKFIRTTAAALIIVSYLAQSLNIFGIKEHNYQILKARENEIVAKIDQTPEHGTYEVGNLDAGLKRDWVLPDFFFPIFIEYVRHKNRPDRRVNFSIKTAPQEKF